VPADFQWPCQIFAACATYSRGENSHGIPIGVEIIGLKYWEWGVGMNQREWEEMGTLFFVKLLNPQNRV